MAKRDDPNTRTQIKALIGANVEPITKNLHNLWHRSAEDLLAGGVSHAAIADTMLTVAITHAVVANGEKTTIEQLRAIADLYERLAAERRDQPRAQH